MPVPCTHPRSLIQRRGIASRRVPTRNRGAHARRRHRTGSRRRRRTRGGDRGVHPGRRVLRRATTEQNHRHPRRRIPGDERRDAPSRGQPPRRRAPRRPRRERRHGPPLRPRHRHVRRIPPRQLRRSRAQRGPIHDDQMATPRREGGPGQRAGVHRDSPGEPVGNTTAGWERGARGTRRRARPRR